MPDTELVKLSVTFNPGTGEVRTEIPNNLLLAAGMVSYLSKIVGRQMDASMTSQITPAGMIPPALRFPGGN